MLLILCADKKCHNSKNCLRFAADPITQIQSTRKVRVEASLRQQGYEECSKFIQIKDLSHETHI